VGPIAGPTFQRPGHPAGAHVPLRLHPERRRAVRSIVLLFTPTESSYARRRLDEQKLINELRQMRNADSARD
jgi:hypothetical protein